MAKVNCCDEQKNPDLNGVTLLSVASDVIVYATHIAEVKGLQKKDVVDALRLAVMTQQLSTPTAFTFGEGD
ncbi:hypothetical protein HLI26_07350 [Salmonella enterica subsp. enterica]|uniref:hypothetical protein n=1 Tax=Salmonella enterica TaxID=28901 RepID=UPI0021517E38|nr:hypothetical protein [Salmonella enterica]MCR6026796.1 hypothetical protein [Salmonella enterica subsp. enterica]